MRNLIAVSLLAFSFSSFAISDLKLIEQCRSVGAKKVIEEARFLNIEINEDKIHVCGIDNRSMNIAKYVWFCAEDLKTGEVVSQMTQKPIVGKCF